MGFQDDKGKIFEEIGVFKVMEGLPKEKKPSSFDSVKSKSKNLLPFMLDLLSSSCADNAKTLKDKARCSGSRILKDVLIDFLPELARISKEGVVKAIKAGLACGTDFSIPSNLPGTSNGTPEFTDKIDKVDFTDLMKVDPTSPTGNLLFGKNNKDFNRRLVETIQSAPTSTGGIKSDKWTTQSGVDLLAGDSINIDVEVVAPNEEETIFYGDIVLVNSENQNDTCIINARLATPLIQIQGISQIPRLLQNNPRLLTLIKQSLEI